MTTYTIRSNLDSANPLPGILIPSLGFYVPSGGQSVAFTDDGNINEINEDVVTGDLATLLDDNAFPGGGDAFSASLILNIDGTDIDEGAAERAVNAVPLTIETQDAATSIAGLTKLKVTNGTLTDDGNGEASLNTGGGGGGSGTVNEVNDGTTTVSNPDTIRIAETGTVTEPVAGTAQIAIRPAVDYAGQFTGVTIGTGDITVGKWGLFFRTTDSRAFHVWNVANTLYAAELTAGML